MAGNAGPHGKDMIMLTHLPFQGPHRQRARSVGGRLGRAAAVLAALAGAVLASAAVIPAA